MLTGIWIQNDGPEFIYFPQRAWFLAFDCVLCVKPFPSELFSPQAIKGNNTSNKKPLIVVWNLVPQAINGNNIPDINFDATNDIF